MPEFTRTSTGAAFDSEQLAELRNVYEQACDDLGIAAIEGNSERRSSVARLVIDMAEQGLRGDDLRAGVVTMLKGRPR